MRRIIQQIKDTNLSMFNATGASRMIQYECKCQNESFRHQMEEACIDRIRNIQIHTKKKTGGNQRIVNRTFRHDPTVSWILRTRLTKRESDVCIATLKQKHNFLIFNRAKKSKSIVPDSSILRSSSNKIRTNCFKNNKFRLVYAALTNQTPIVWLSYGKTSSCTKMDLHS